MTFTLDRSIDVLRRTPATLHTLLGGLTDFWTRSHYGPDTFSPFDVVGHLIHADRANWLPRLRHILGQGGATPFPMFDRYAMYEADKGKSTADLLHAFASIRAEALDQLEAMNLTEEELDRRGVHPQLGPVTMRNVLAAWVVHDLNHLQQVAKAMAFQYRDEVGPFREFLSILPKP